MSENEDSYVCMYICILTEWSTVASIDNTLRYVESMVFLEKKKPPNWRKSIQPIDFPFVPSLSPPPSSPGPIMYTSKITRRCVS